MINIQKCVTVLMKDKHDEEYRRGFGDAMKTVTSVIADLSTEIFLQPPTDRVSGYLEALKDVSVTILERTNNE